LIVTVIDLEQPLASVAVYVFPASKLVVAVALKVIVPVPPVGVLKTTDPFHQNI
jgi:hypothetical protein